MNPSASLPLSHFEFGSPGLEIWLVGGLTSLFYFIPMWSLCRVWLRSQPLTNSMFFESKMYGAIIVVSWLILPPLFAIRNYGVFWNLTLLNSGQVELDYWFPRPDRRLSSHEIAKLKFVTSPNPGKGQISHLWSLYLTTTAGAEYKSAFIKDEQKARSAIAALEQWAGRDSIPYWRERGLFDRPYRKSP